MDAAHQEIVDGPEPGGVANERATGYCVWRIDRLNDAD